MRRLRAETEVHAGKGAAGQAVGARSRPRSDATAAGPGAKDHAYTTQTAEHPFGTIKAWMGATHFRLRTLEKVKTEMSLHVLAYNLKRMIAILGRAAAHPGDQGRLTGPSRMKV